MAVDFMSFLRQLSPEAQGALISGGLGIGGGVLSGMGQQKMNDQDRAFNLASQIASIQQRQLENQTQDQQFLEQLALARSQADPLTAEKSRAGFAMNRDVVANARPVDFQFDNATGQGRLSGGFGIPQGGFSPDTLKQFEQPPVAQQLANQVATSRPAVSANGSPIDTLHQMQPNNGQPIPDGYEWKNGQLQKKGGGIGGFFKKLGKVALAAAPIVAAPFTGGASLALIGAGAGAASGALSGGGLKGALMGGALGAIPGLGSSGAAAGTAATQGAGAAIKGALLNPQSLAKLGGTAIGGPTGSAMQLASMLLPGQAPIAPLDNHRGNALLTRIPASPYGIPQPPPPFIDNSVGDSYLRRLSTGRVQ